MAHGERAAENENHRKEFGSRRLPGWPSKGTWTKFITHRKERREAKEQLRNYLIATNEVTEQNK